MIELYHIFKQYQPPVWALYDITFQIGKGEFVIITGPSGAGKTTLLRIIFRELLPTKGQIIVNGRNTLIMPSHKIYLLRRIVGFVFQDFKLLPQKTVFENVALPLIVTGTPFKLIRKKVFNALKMVGLHHKMKAYPLSLSGGEQQRVAIARAIVNEPLILLADEPTGNLDPELSYEIMNFFKEFSLQGTTVVVATHDKELIKRFGKRVIFLDKGRLVGEERN
ncbi:cell division ATP-binding protein FtsE [SCandidatus Aminicenantes bacterium Aminicenantia_JdfR_composite]|jgi:cell division transport system ATP-binding protein|nr:cell division ATP-binding protein FtsE [SCandidatus Aminicenantes bacterium Aminicenantia_JdfR_composite]MCP2597380.1 cell division ATP-binding protein FtsE [Candidatus Aminicenantes bacterium AC-335-G13]